MIELSTEIISWSDISVTITMSMMKAILVFFTLLAAVLASTQINLQYPEEWQLWKSEHSKSYATDREEIDRHLVWLSNREYINAHNKNAHIFGFTLAMNHFGDIVSKHEFTLKQCSTILNISLCMIFIILLSTYVCVCVCVCVYYID